MLQARELSAFTLDLSQPVIPSKLPGLAAEFRPFLEPYLSLAAVPDVASLLPGDIILKLSPGSAIAAFQFECGPPKLPKEAYQVSHVAIYASHGNVIEATPHAISWLVPSLRIRIDGVRATSLFGKDYIGTRITVRRMPNLLAEEREAIRAAAEVHMGQAYGTRDIADFGWVYVQRKLRRLILRLTRKDQISLAPPLPILDAASAFDSVICSELVEESYAKILGRHRIKIPAAEQTFAQPLPCNYYKHDKLDPVPLSLCRV